MARVFEFSIGDHVRAQGRSVSRARAAALDVAARMLSGSYRPRFVATRGRWWLVWREPHGWSYCEAPAPRIGVEAGRFGSIELAERGALRAGAVEAWTLSERDDSMADVVLHARDRAELVDWASLQRALDHGSLALGLHGVALQEYACAHAAEFRRDPEQREGAERGA